MSDLDCTTWDHHLQELGGPFHQSWRWGEFKREVGWDVERIFTSSGAGVGMTQILFKTRGPVNTAPKPRGPHVSGNTEAILPELFAAIDNACRQRRVIKLNIEPACPLPLTEIPNPRPLVAAQERFTPDRTAIVTLSDDQTMVQQMYAAKRRELRRAERQGIVVIDGSAKGETSEAFRVLMRDTAARNHFATNSEASFTRFLELFGDDAALRLVTVDGHIAAGLVAVKFRNQVVNMVGSSSTQCRRPVATALLQFRPMQWARDQGCRQYDLWGIPSTDPAGSARGGEYEPLRSIGQDKAGLYRFKVELGGAIVSLPSSYDVHYHPVLTSLLRRAKQLKRAMVRS